MSASTDAGDFPLASRCTWSLFLVPPKTLQEISIWISTLHAVMMEEVLPPDTCPVPSQLQQLQLEDEDYYGNRLCASLNITSEEN